MDTVESVEQDKYRLLAARPPKARHVVASVRSVGGGGLEKDVKGAKEEEYCVEESPLVVVVAERGMGVRVILLLPSCVLEEAVART